MTWQNPWPAFRCRPHANPPNRSRIAVITWSNRIVNYRPVELVICGYCVRHGYDRLVNESIFSTPEPLSGIQWQRIPFILDVLPLYEAVLHLDDDSVINHLEYPVERLMAAYSDRELLVTAVEVRGRRFQGTPKSSTMLIRNTPFMRHFFRRFLTDTACAPFRNNSECCREQDCLWHLMSPGAKPVDTHKIDRRFGVLSSADLDCRDAMAGASLFHVRIIRGNCSSPFVWHAIGTPGFLKWKYVYTKAITLAPIASRDDWMAGRVSLQADAKFSSGRSTPQLLSTMISAHSAARAERRAAEHRAAALRHAKKQNRSRH